MAYDMLIFEQLIGVRCIVLNLFIFCLFASYVFAYVLVSKSTKHISYKIINIYFDGRGK